MAILPFEQHQPDIDDSALVHASAQVIGDVKLDADVSIWPMSVIRGDIQQIHIGARSNIQDGSVVHVTHDGPYAPGGFAVAVGHDVTVGHNVTLHGCQIGNFCLIGMGSIIMDGCVIEDENIVGAGSLVTPGKTLQSGYLWMGRPARRVRELSEQERDYLRYSASYYVDLKNRHKYA